MNIHELDLESLRDDEVATVFDDLLNTVRKSPNSGEIGLYIALYTRTFYEQYKSRADYISSDASEKRNWLEFVGGTIPQLGMVIPDRSIEPYKLSSSAFYFWSYALAYRPKLVDYIGNHLESIVQEGLSDISVTKPFREKFSDEVFDRLFTSFKAEEESKAEEKDVPVWMKGLDIPSSDTGTCDECGKPYCPDREGICHDCDDINEDSEGESSCPDCGSTPCHICLECHSCGDHKLAFESPPSFLSGYHLRINAYHYLGVLEELAMGENTHHEEIESQFDILDFFEEMSEERRKTLSDFSFRDSSQHTVRMEKLIKLDEANCKSQLSKATCKSYYEAVFRKLVVCEIKLAILGDWDPQEDIEETLDALIRFCANQPF